MQAVGTKNRTSLHSIDGSAFKTRGSLSIGRESVRKRGSLSFGISMKGVSVYPFPRFSTLLVLVQLFDQKMHRVQKPGLVSFWTLILLPKLSFLVYITIFSFVSSLDEKIHDIRQN